MLTRYLHQLRSLIAPRAQASRHADGSTEFECRVAEGALAVCVDSLRQDVARVEVRIGRELAGRTNPQQMKTDVHRAARSFVRDGRTTYALSVDWADALERQDRVYVRVHSRAGEPVRPGTGRRPSARETDEVRREIADEFAFALKELQSRATAPVVVRALTVVCRDAQADEWLSGLAADGTSFSRSLRTLAERRAKVAPDFEATYRFDPEMAGTTAVGQGLIAVDVVLQPNDKRDTHSRPKPEQAPARSATFEICDERPIARQSQVRVTLIGLGREPIGPEPAVHLDLPALINRDVLAGTSLASNAENLRLVSESNPLRVELRDNRLYLSANARRNQAGPDRPGYFLVDRDREIPIVGEREVGDEAEVVIGSESHRTGRSPRGDVLRPPRIRIVAVRETGPT